ncbi:MAG: hypothetical protein A3D87_00805 [Omnitrophica WOR_2 bacterium RIFCSPHIGHO2_02_FULL_50_17]|nr:MAG: hypothetical protein A3D87_00805 [Omnitrophica WOR_2 bacterium RIFCSPHIGHO2_02_FULL_50_17]
MLLKPFTFHAPKTLQSALELYAALRDVRLQAGGTFLLNSLKLLKKKAAKTPQNILSLEHIKELKGISVEQNTVTIRSMTTMDEMHGSSLLTDYLSILKVSVKNIATQPVRNMATIGGNLTCRYTWTEMPAVMIALGAKMHFRGTDGSKEGITAEEFFHKEAKTGGIFTHVTIPRDRDVCAAYFRAKKSPFVDIPLLSLCVTTRFQHNKFSGTIVVVNNAVTFARRDRVLEDFLNQKGASKEVIEEAVSHLDDPIYDTRSSDYKKHMFRVGIKHALYDLIKTQK